MKQLILGAVAIVVLVGAGLSIMRSARSAGQSPDFVDGMHWLCASCTNGFTTSRDDFAAWVQAHPDQKMPCPKCKKNESVVARKCPLPNCGKYHVERNVVINEKVCCPICKQPLP